MLRREVVAGRVLGVACWLCGLQASLLAQEGSGYPAAPQSFLSDARRVGESAHRLAGTEEGAAVGDYVLQRLRSMGLDEVVEQPFAIAQTFVEECYATAALDGGGKRRLDLLPMRPNGIVPPATPEGGIQGRFLLVEGEEHWKSLAPGAVKGTVVGLSYNCHDRWLRAFQLGAAAVVFHESDQPEPWHSHYVDTNVNIPRYYFRGPKDELRNIETIDIRCKMSWKTVEARNIYGFARGAAPNMGLGAGETFVLSVPLDSYGEVPRATPGGRGAWNIASLLRIAEQFAASRPKRNVLLAFLDNQSRGHAGSYQLYGSLETDDNEARLSERRRSHARELDWMTKLAAALESDDPIEAAGELRKNLVIRLKETIERETSMARMELAELRKASYAGESQEEQGGQAQRIEELDALLDRWNDLKRYLATGSSQGSIDMQLRQALAVASEDVQARLQELAIEARSLEAAAELQRLLGGSHISFHLSLLLGDTTDRWAVVSGGESLFSHSSRESAGLYGRIFSGMAEIVGDLRAAGESVEGFLPSAVDGTFARNKALWGAPALIYGAEPATWQGIYGLALITVQENLRREGTPGDILEAYDASRIFRQAEEAAFTLAAAANSPALSIRHAIPEDYEFHTSWVSEKLRLFGRRVLARMPGGSTATQRLPGVVLQLKPTGLTSDEKELAGANSLLTGLQYQWKRRYAFDDFMVVPVNRQGGWSSGPVRRKWMGHTAFAAAFDERGLVQYVTDLDSTEMRNELGKLFPSKQGYWILPTQVFPEKARVFDGLSNSPLLSDESYYRTEDGVVSVYADLAVNRVKVFSERAIASLGMSGEDSDSFGEGWELPFFSPPLASPQVSARDILAVNGFRLEKLRSRSLESRSVSDYHTRLEIVREKADASAELEEWNADLHLAYLAGRQVYSQLRGGIKDLVNAALFLLLLVAPFSFVLERLLIGEPNIYRQTAWFAVIFLACFAALYFTHPAFAISAFPAIILLGFLILILSSVVILILFQRFEAEIKAAQGLGMSVHRADVSRLGTIMAAMGMGISTMRRRPLRTTLTAVTVILLTFTILSFASIGEKLGLRSTYIGPSLDYAGVQYHDVNWRPVEDAMLDLLEGRFGEDATVAGRYWLTPELLSADQAVNTEQALLRLDGSRAVSVTSFLGLDRSEYERRSDFQRLLERPEGAWEDSVWLPRPVADALEVERGDTIMARGFRVRVAGVFDSSSALLLSDLDGSSVIPVNLAEGGEREGVAQQSGAAPTMGSWKTVSPSSIAVFSSGALRRMGGDLRLISLYVNDTGQAEAVGEELAAMLDAPVSATLEEGASWMIFGTYLEGSGFSDILLPVVLGGLVVFGTMLGSVSDREREIYTFSALGLAPQHVAGLFFAEGLVFSLVGGMGGYLFSQAFVRALEVLADYGWMSAPDLNYSSLNAVVTLIIVMLTVMVSAAYPALRASRSANPGLQRQWRMPSPEGDLLDARFPFTVSEYDFLGALSFLNEHFSHFRDSSVGLLLVERTGLEMDEKRGPCLRARLSIAPFDLGVTEDLLLYASPSGIEGLEEIHFEIARLSGQPDDWERLNRVFMKDLRKQFLIWRSLPSDTVERYWQTTMDTLPASEMEDSKQA